MQVTNLKEQAVEMLQRVPDDKMVYVITVLKSLDNTYDGKNKNFNKIPFAAPNGSSQAVKEWEGFKAYKGIIAYRIDEKEELAKARNEKYADFN